MEFYDFSFRGVGRYTTNQPFVGLVSGNLLQFAIENNPFMNFSHELYGFFVCLPGRVNSGNLRIDGAVPSIFLRSFSLGMGIV